MDFKSVLTTLLKGFEQNDVRYGLMDGFALGLWGVGRSTVDLDFLILLESREAVSKVMSDMGYELKYESENVSQYVSPVKIFGEIDFLHAFRDASRGMLDRAVEKDAFDGKVRVKVLMPEDVIGLKLQAIANDSSREQNDMADIEALLEVRKEETDWELLRGYCDTLHRSDLFKDLQGRYGK